MPINPCHNPKCDYFNRSLPSTAKNCPMCGQPLGNAFPSAHSHAPSQSAPQPVPSQPAPPPALADYNSAPPIPSYAAAPVTQPQLKLIHTITQQEFYLPQTGGYIGRRSLSNPNIPEIDLAGIPQEGVVSRMHVRLSWDATQNTYLIWDNSSRNGTFLSGMQLKPNVAYPISHGMVLQLGQDNLVSFTVAIA